MTLFLSLNLVSHNSAANYGRVKCKGSVSQFVVERASLMIHCRISQTLL